VPALLVGGLEKTNLEDLRSLNLLNREVDRHPDCQTIAKLYGEKKHLKRKSGGLQPDVTEALIFVQRAISKF
jgi:hypothetical protein